jgi:hypothetical protein
MTDRGRITLFYFKNVLDTGFLQPMSPNTFDNTGQRYNVRKIVDKMGRLIPSNYQKYSPPFMSAKGLVGMIGTFAYTTGSE